MPPAIPKKNGFMYMENTPSWLIRQPQNSASNNAAKNMNQKNKPETLHFMRLMSTTNAGAED